MWKSIQNIGSSLRHSKNETLTTASGMPFPCSSPLRVFSEPLDMSDVEVLLGEMRVVSHELMTLNDWVPVHFKDPDGEDIKLFTRPVRDKFTFAKATMTVKNCTPNQIVSVMHSDNEADRKRFSANLTKFRVLKTISPTCNIQYNEYRAPPPVSPRGFYFLVKKDDKQSDGSIYIYGCSVNYTSSVINEKSVICASSLWCWSLTPNGSETNLVYVNVVNLKGWTPTIIVEWLKSEIGRELRAARNILYGIKFELIREDSVNISEADLHDVDNDE